MKLAVDNEADNPDSHYYFTVGHNGGSIILKTDNSNLITNASLCDEKHKDLMSRIPAYWANDVIVVALPYYEEDWCDIYIEGNSIKMNFKPFEDGMNPVLRHIVLLVLPVLSDGKNYHPNSEITLIPQFD